MNQKKRKPIVKIEITRLAAIYMGLPHRSFTRVGWGKNAVCFRRHRFKGLPAATLMENNSASMENADGHIAYCDDCDRQGKRKPKLTPLFLRQTHKGVVDDNAFHSE